MPSWHAWNLFQTQWQMIGFRALNSCFWVQSSHIITYIYIYVMKCTERPNEKPRWEWVINWFMLPDALGIQPQRPRVGFRGWDRFARGCPGRAARAGSFLGGQGEVSEGKKSNSAVFLGARVPQVRTRRWVSIRDTLLNIEVSHSDSLPKKQGLTGKAGARFWMQQRGWPQRQMSFTETSPVRTALFEPKKNRKIYRKF